MPKRTIDGENTSDEHTHLLATTRSRSLSAALTFRAKIVLACERGPSNAVVATRLGIGPHMAQALLADRIEGSLRRDA
jgi:putative transposase